MERRVLPAKRLRDATEALEAREASPERRRRVAFAPSPFSPENAAFSTENEAESGGLQRLARFAAGIHGGGGAPWRLAAAHSVEDNEKYLNEQLELAVALSDVTEGQKGRKQSYEKPKMNVFALLELVKSCKMVDMQREEQAEKLVREAMDVVSYLLHMRNREMEHQNDLSEHLRMAEKEASRKQNVVETLRGELEAQKMTLAQHTNVFKAKEQALMAERKTLQTEKKALEVQCARFGCCLFTVDEEKIANDVILLLFRPGCKELRRLSKLNCDARTQSTSG